MNSPLLAAAVISVGSGALLHFSRILDTAEAGDAAAEVGMTKTLQVIAVTIAAGLTYLATAYAKASPVPVVDSVTLDVLEPKGGTRAKNAIARLMARISRFKEKRKFAGSSAAEHEAFHHAEPHPFFNESHYYNGMDAITKDRFITRIGRHGEGGHENYVFLLLDTKQHGVLSLECDHVPVDHSLAYPTAKGLKYECIEPLKRWKVTYEGEMARGLHGPDGDTDAKKKDRETVFVSIDLEYTAETPLFWYMRDDNRETLAKNLSQEPWGVAFVNMCLNRTNNHGHYEDFGRCVGTIKISKNETEGTIGKEEEKEMTVTKYDFGTFRDHSWDIRMWATMDRLLILLLEMPTPLHINGKTYDYLDLTLVDMPGNAGGVQKYTTGYLLSKSHGDILPVQHASSIDVQAVTMKSDGKTREPLPKTSVVMAVGMEGCGTSELVELQVDMSGAVRRLEYWPDAGAFHVYEDSLEVTTMLNRTTGVSIDVIGTRQTGFREGEYDPTLGGCG